MNGGASLPNRRASKEALSNLRRIPFEKRDLVIANTIVNLLSRKENHAMALEDLKIRAELALTPNGNKRIVLMPKYFTNVYR